MMVKKEVFLKIFHRPLKFEKEIEFKFKSKFFIVDIYINRLKTLLWRQHTSIMKSSQQNIHTECSRTSLVAEEIKKQTRELK